MPFEPAGVYPPRPLTRHGPLHSGFGASDVAVVEAVVVAVVGVAAFVMLLQSRSWHPTGPTGSIRSLEGPTGKPSLNRTSVVAVVVGVNC